MSFRPVSVALLIAILQCSGAGVAQAFQPPAVNWTTGEAFETQLQLPGSVTWGEMPLRQGLENLARTNRVAIWLDRRVDPDQKITVQLAEAPFEQLLERLVARLELRTARVGPVVYVGPEGTQNLGTLAAMKRQESETLPAAVRGKMASLAPTRWEKFSQPRELLEKNSARCGLRSFYLEQIPHDLWPAADLPAMHGAELLTLLLAGFNLSYQYAPDGSAVRPIPIPQQILLVKEYAYGGDLRAATTKIREFFPQAQLKPGARKIEVAGSAEEHREIARFLSGKPMRKVTAVMGDKLYTLEIKDQPIGAIMLALARQLGRDVEFDPALTVEQLEQRVSFSVKEKSLAELLNVALQPAGMRYELTTKLIAIKPK